MESILCFTCTQVIVTSKCVKDQFRQSLGYSRDTSISFQKAFPKTSNESSPILFERFVEFFIVKPRPLLFKGTNRTPHLLAFNVPPFGRCASEASTLSEGSRRSEKCIAVVIANEHMRLGCAVSELTLVVSLCLPSVCCIQFPALCPLRLVSWLFKGHIQVRMDNMWCYYYYFMMVDGHV